MHACSCTCTHAWARVCSCARTHIHTHTHYQRETTDTVNPTSISCPGDCSLLPSLCMFLIQMYSKSWPFLLFSFIHAGDRAQGVPWLGKYSTLSCTPTPSVPYFSYIASQFCEIHILSSVWVTSPRSHRGQMAGLVSVARMSSLLIRRCVLLPDTLGDNFVLIGQKDPAGPSKSAMCGSAYRGRLIYGGLTCCSHKSSMGLADKLHQYRWMR